MLNNVILLFFRTINWCYLFCVKIPYSYGVYESLPLLFFISFSLPLRLPFIIFVVCTYHICLCLLSTTSANKSDLKVFLTFKVFLVLLLFRNVL